VCEECLKEAEPLGLDGAAGSLDRRLARVGALRPGRRRCVTLVRVEQSGEPVRHGVAQLIGLEGRGATVLAEHPAREQVYLRVLGLEDLVLDRPGIGQRALDPPGGVARHGDAGRARRLADLPGAWDPVLLDVELGGNPEVALPPRREADVAADTRDLERPDGVSPQVVPDDVPVAVVEAEREGVQDALGRPRALRAPVPELDGALLRDGRFELREAAG
jgi:hypothetical protein